MKFLKCLMAGFSLVVLASCASQQMAKEKVAAEIKNETVVKREELKVTAHETIMNSQLSAEQKKELLALQEKTIKETTAINEEINKTKMVLIKTLMNPKANPRELSILKKDLRKLSKKNMEVTLNAFDQGRKIISPVKDQEQREQLFNTFMSRQNNSIY